MAERWDDLITLAERGLRIDRREPEFYWFLARGYWGLANIKQAKAFAQQGLRFVQQGSLLQQQLNTLLKSDV